MTTHKDTAEHLSGSPLKGSCIPQRMIVSYIEVYNITVFVQV